MHKFVNGRQPTEDIDQSGRPPSTKLDDFIGKLQDLLNEDNWRTCSRRASYFELSKNSVHRILKEKIVAKWVPHPLTDERKEDHKRPLQQKGNSFSSALSLATRRELIPSNLAWPSTSEQWVAQSWFPKAIESLWRWCTSPFVTTEMLCLTFPFHRSALWTANFTWKFSETTWDQQFARRDWTWPKNELFFFMTTHLHIVPQSQRSSSNVRLGTRCPFAILSWLIILPLFLFSSIKEYLCGKRFADVEVINSAYALHLVRGGFEDGILDLVHRWKNVWREVVTTSM